MKRGRWTEEETALIVKMRRDGWKVQEIANALQRSWHATESRIYRLTVAGVVVEPRCHRWADEELACIVEMRRIGLTVREMADALQRSLNSTQGQVNRLVTLGVIAKKERWPKLPS